VIASGGIDLAVGSILALCAVERDYVSMYREFRNHQKMMQDANS